MRLIWLRHGETDGNRRKQYVGRKDYLLNETGIKQSEQAAARLKRFFFDCIYFSPLLRTEKTAEIAAAGRNIEKISDIRIAELDFGQWDGLTYVEIEQIDRERLWKWYDDPWLNSPPDGERLFDLDRRLQQWLNEILVLRSDQSILAVSHAGMIRWFLSKYVLQDESQFHSISFGPAQYAACTYKNGIWKLSEE